MKFGPDGAGAREIVRERLGHIVRERDPRLIVISAPAGYGKSTFVRQLLTRLDGPVVCDCLNVRDETDLARAVLAALAAARPAWADAIAQAQLGAINNPSDWRAIALHFWGGDDPATVVFENAETLIRSNGASALFARLVRAGSRRVIVCSRDVIPVPYGHGLDPTNVATFGIEDLRFSAQEIRTALPDSNPGEQAAIEAISRGWPIVVALLGRAARERPFIEVVAGLDTVVHDELLIYLASELIGDLNDREAEIALILAALPDPTYEDVARGWPAVTMDDIDRFAARVPLARGVDGIIRLHPMVVQLFRERGAARIAPMIEQAAEAARAHGDDIRAAELYLAIGDEIAAAGALRNLGAFIMSSPAPRLAAVMSRFDEKTLLAFPALWCSAMNHRGYAIPPYEWLRSAQAIWSRLPAEAPEDVRASVFSTLLNAHTNIGQCSQAAVLLARYRATVSPADPYGYGVATLWSAALDSFDGRYDRIPAYTKTLTSLLEHSDLAHALYLYDVISAIPRTRGEWSRDAELLGRARELFERTPLSIALLGFVESAFASWLAGDDEACDAFVAELERRVTTANERGHRFFIACTRGGAAAVPYGYEKAKARAQGLLIAGARADTRDAAHRFLADAVVVADQSERRYLRILARCALALLDDTRREELLREALSIAAGLDSTPMSEAVIALLERRSDAGMLARFAARYEIVRGRKGVVEVRALRGEVFVGGKPVALSRSELAVLFALAQLPRSFSVCELGDLLFPDLDADSAGNRVYVYVHRLRQRLGRDAVLAESTGYRLGATVDVDLWRLDSLATKSSASEQLGDAEAAELLAFEPLSTAEIEAFALRLRLPERLVGTLRTARARSLSLRSSLDMKPARPAGPAGGAVPAAVPRRTLISEPEIRHHA